ncbi:MAG: hypothetical protein ACE5HW_01360 [Candidatus Methanofastidiosia archaeon]
MRKFFLLMLSLFLISVRAEPPFQLGEDWWFENSTIIKSKFDWTYTLEILGDHILIGKVLEIHTYREQEYVFSPMDLVVGRDKAAKEGFFENFNIIMENRYFRYEYTGTDEYILEDAYIISHVSNIHLIPRNSEVLEGLMALQVGDDVKIVGKLVNVRGRGKEGSLEWNSSKEVYDIMTKPSLIILVEVLYINEIEHGATRLDQRISGMRALFEDFKKAISIIFSEASKLLRENLLFVLLILGVLALLPIINVLILTGYKAKTGPVCFLTLQGRESSIDYLKNFEHMSEVQIEIIKLLRKRNQVSLNELYSKFGKDDLLFLITEGYVRVQKE